MNERHVVIDWVNRLERGVAAAVTTTTAAAGTPHNRRTAA